MSTDEITLSVQTALKEDLGGTLDPRADLTSALIPEGTSCEAVIITREAGIFCGRAWVEEVYRILAGDKVSLEFLAEDGSKIAPGQEIVRLKGDARLVLTGERTALNFLQSLSGAATTVSAYTAAIAGTATKLLDTRKTIPGLRKALKYAVTCGGGHNHRMGLHDMYLIKENHIIACGSISKAVAKAKELRPSADVEIEVEVASLKELQEAIDAGVDIVMLDNFEFEDMEKAVALNDHRCRLEISGNVTIDTIASFAAIGIDYISVGALTKNLRALDMSLRLISEQQAAKPAEDEDQAAADTAKVVISDKESVI
ncbi:MAG: carboxylating nicotinate-nucleotide diphosphorylase [Proteobacteria bacterium]|uniref:nicotinate-nucleotide diphosphorylase (carboxylating) n=1 Tax=Candidatus Avisuccinivibrio stercorigallinarum TaxID=2840704 RepID=A0A9D9DCW6_9GAMM|nr:carboxylating nicotinate-nucleotide diphosphorylase [Candidatus Avisuccinivibrio stercorigallinarum]